MSSMSPVGSSAGHAIVFDAPNAIWTTAKGINAIGEVAGSFGSPNPGSDIRGFVRDRSGNFSIVDIPGHNTEVLGINARSELTGYVYTGPTGPPFHGFVRTPEGALG